MWRGGAALNRAGAVAVGLVIGGALGNLADRALRTDGGGLLSGGVVDFIDFQWWPVFNVADSAVVIGALLFAALSVSGSDGDGGDGEGHDEPGDELADADTRT